MRIAIAVLCLCLCGGGSAVAAMRPRLVFHARRAKTRHRGICSGRPRLTAGRSHAGRVDRIRPAAHIVVRCNTCRVRSRPLLGRLLR
jgi:hypothetical protein